MTTLPAGTDRRPQAIELTPIDLVPDDATGDGPDPRRTFDADRWRILEDAQREADTMFAQYQLSQLLASGDSLETMAAAVLEELVRNTDAAAGAVWLSQPDGKSMSLVGVHLDSAPGTISGPASIAGIPVPATFAAIDHAIGWASGTGWFGVTLDESRDLGARGLQREAIGFLALDAGTGRRLAGDHARFLGLVRHELAMAFRAAQLREVLAGERAILSAILDGASDSILAVDGERYVVRLNPAAAALLGARHAVGERCETVLGCRQPSLVAARAPAEPASLACGERCPFAEVLAGAPPVANRERDVPGRDGPVPVAGSYARMPGGEDGAVGVLRDLRPSRELDELKSSFVAAVSHELRTPLALISGYAQTLQHLDLDEARRRHYVEQITVTTDRLTGLVNQILEIARLEGDRLRLHRQPVSLAALVRDTTAQLRAEQDVAIDIDIAEDLPAAEADPEHLGQVIDNLVGNALKYAGRAAPVRILARTRAGDLVVSVVDSGPGIAAGERPLVFERFFRGRSVAQSRTPGSGLGLFLCRRIVEAHGGRIWLDEVATGTSVSFNLPVARSFGADRSVD
jgi:signal transduction histidine kinase